MRLFYCIPLFFPLVACHSTPTPPPVSVEKALTARYPSATDTQFKPLITPTAPTSSTTPAETLSHSYDYTRYQSTAPELPPNPAPVILQTDAINPQTGEIYRATNQNNRLLNYQTGELAQRHNQYLQTDKGLVRTIPR